MLKVRSASNDHNKKDHDTKLCIVVVDSQECSERATHKCGNGVSVYPDADNPHNKHLNYRILYVSKYGYRGKMKARCIKKWLASSVSNN